ncbi:MCE family protein [Antrihabitans cavernicola]|uniref:MCE family protein n=1 Tax=Antrihabitans cavernicola TaxID=2495913 RepID=A0A5A7S6G6_9NOCA|nr:MCE family protein [Spelaeibacter cavernicola]KAA0019439.1 MCE family protein [Spelaeibacter cavernicola]
MTTNKAKVGIALVAAAVVATASGCSVTVDKLPLPKPSVQGESYKLHAVFENALNLPAQAKVKIGGSDVGMVTDITTENFQADVSMDIRKDVELPEGTTAELRQATPLGDVFVAMSMPPKTPGVALLKDGATLGLDKTSAGATVEDILVSVSMLVNGGGLNQLSRIVTELDSAVAGRGPQLGHLVVELTNTIGSLNQRTAEIDGVLKQFDTVTATLNQRHAELGQVADSLPPMIGTLAENNRAIGDVLGKISTASAALGDFADTSSGELQGMLDNVSTLMGSLTQAGDNLGGTLDALHNLSPGVLATLRGNSLAVSATLSYLAIGDPSGSHLPNGSDVNAFVGSLAEVLQRLQARVTGGTR